MCNLGNINRYFRKIFFTSKEWFVITKIRYLTNMIYVRDFRANIFLSQRKDLLPLWKYSLPQGNICFIGRIILYLKERFVTPRKIFATWGNIRDPSGYYVLFEEIFSSSKIRFVIWPVYVRDIRVNIRYLSKNICYLRGNIRYLMGKFCYLRRNIRYPKDKIIYLRSQILSYINYPSEKIR